MNFILTEMNRDDGGLNHNFKNTSASINGYLEDYAFVIQALIRLYQCTFNTEWLTKASDLTSYVLSHFSDDSTGLLYFTSDIDPPLIVRKFEVQDNVIPASASQMSINLFQLGHYLDNQIWISRSRKMLLSMREMISGYGSAWSNWLIGWQYWSQPLQELVICGEQALEFRGHLSSGWLHPTILTGGCLNEESIPMTISRLDKSKTRIYFCIDHTCRLPVDSPFLFSIR